MDLDPNAIYRQMTDDDLAEMVLSLKEQMADLRTTCWRAEDELRNRLLERNAKRLQGEKFLVKSSVKRDVKWDQAALVRAQDVADREGLVDLFRQAFPLKYDASIRNLNALLKFGGQTAEAIEAAKSEVNEKIELAYEPAR
jgi:ribosomal protein L29